MRKKKSVREFFDEISDQYDAKYDVKANKFLAHFFRRRIEIATDGLPMSLGTVLDIGAGTGQLYRFLLENGYSFDNYVAVDISGGMLSQSIIPKDSRYVGDIHLPELDFYRGTVDHIFLLGVTTYMASDELADALKRIEQLSKDDGLLICTFTNRNSIELMAQSIISWLLYTFSRLTGSGLNVVAAQRFPRLIVSEKAMKAFLSPHGTTEGVFYVNQTLTPVNRILPMASIRLESFLNHMLQKWPRALAPLSSDILFRIRMERK